MLQFFRYNALHKTRSANFIFLWSFLDFCRFYWGYNISGGSRMFERRVGDLTELYRNIQRQNRLGDSSVPFHTFKLKRPQREGWLATQSTPPPPGCATEHTVTSYKKPTQVHVPRPTSQSTVFLWRSFSPSPSRLHLLLRLVTWAKWVLPRLLLWLVFMPLWVETLDIHMYQELHFCLHHISLILFLFLLRAQVTPTQRRLSFAVFLCMVVKLQTGYCTQTSIKECRHSIDFF